MGKRNARSDIPYADRLLYERFNTVRDHRNDAARTALKLGCVALNNTEGLGYVRLVRFAVEQQKLTEEYYKDPEVQEKHLNDRLTQMGFVTKDGRLLGATDQDGNPVKASDVVDQTQLSERRQLFSGWIDVKDKLPAICDPVLTCRKDKDGNVKVEQGIRLPDGNWKVYGTRTNAVLFWMAMPEAPAM